MMRLITLSLALLVACGDKGSDDTHGNHGDDDDDDVNLCEAQDSSSIPVAETAFTDTYPTPEGGSLWDGVYDLTEMRIYSPGTPDGTIRNWRLVVEGGTLVTIQPGSEDMPEIMGGTYQEDGTNLQINLSCPQSTTVSVPYTATADQIWLFDPSEPNIKVYTKQ